MNRTIVETIERGLNRRSFLARAAVLTGAFVTGLLVAPNRASAKPPWGCCSLCFEPGSRPWPSDCACVWCWVCPEPVSCLKFKCYECIMSFEYSCTPQICQCWTYDRRDGCRICAGVVSSTFQVLGRYYPCNPA
jgi:hypothetical protein